MNVFNVLVAKSARDAPILVNAPTAIASRAENLRRVVSTEFATDVMSTFLALFAIFEKPSSTSLNFSFCFNLSKVLRVCLVPASN